jgi:ribosomal protein L30/L7E
MPRLGLLGLRPRGAVEQQANTRRTLIALGILRLEKTGFHNLSPMRCREH